MKNFRDSKGGFGGGLKREKPTFQHKSWGVDRGQSYGRDRDKPLYKAVCSECGKQCEVPFRPSGDKPVFCSDCFNSKREATDSRGGGRPEFSNHGPKREFNDRHAPRNDYVRPADPRAPFKPAPAFDETKKQLSDISMKLDRLISALEKISSVEDVQTFVPADVAPKKITPVVPPKVSKPLVKAPVKAVAKKVAPKKVIAKKKK